ncbi:DUF4340 domain-containing protein [Aureispira anguillae]|nr:DUF4340 domain-containing protein [Aureispira anguillae]
MGRIIVLVVLFCGLGTFAFWKMNNPNMEKDTYAGNLHTMFALNNIDPINRVFLTDRSGNQALIERVEDLNWTYTNKVTGKKYRANPSAVYTLLQTLQKIRTREPINSAAMDNAVKSLAAKSTKVEIYDKDQNKLRVYYVGAMTNGGTGNLAIMEGSDQPYVAYIPNFQGTIGTRFITTEADWRDKAIFRNDINKLEFIQVDYQAPSQRTQSFKISKLNSGKFNVEPLNAEVEAFTQEQVNQDNASTYFEDFDVIAAEQIIYDKNLRDTTITTTPFAVVSYKASYHNEPQVFRIYSIYNPSADRGDGEAGHRQKIQRYFVDINEDNFFLAQHIVIRSMLWGYNFFFQREAVQLREDEATTKQSFPENKERDRNQQFKVIQE